MGVQVIHDKNNLLGSGINLIYKAANLFCPVNNCPGLFYRMNNPSGMWLDKAKYADRAITYVFGIYFCSVSRTHKQWFPFISKNLIRFFVHTPDREPFIIWQLETSRIF
jgi:hypothetical protein